jgi:hypothetical protein
MNSLPQPEPPSSTYFEFLKSKVIKAVPTGFTPQKPLSKKLKPFQRDITDWAIRRGRAAIFADCGLGKTPMQLEWAKHVSAYADKPVLTFAPLAVSQQTKREGENKFGVSVQICQSQKDVVAGADISNYEKLQHFPDPSQFAGVILDESSI